MKTITIRRDRIQFEHMASCDCGNSHQEAACAAYIDAATIVLEDAGYTADVDLDHGVDSIRHAVYVTMPDGRTWTERGCITEGHYDDAASPSVAKALAVAAEADSAAWAAAQKAYEADCSCLDTPEHEAEYEARTAEFFARVGEQRASEKRIAALQHVTADQLDALRSAYRVGSQHRARRSKRLYVAAVACGVKTPAGDPAWNTIRAAF